MIYISYGMRKSGSTLAFELTRGLLESLGHPQGRLYHPALPGDHNVNFLNSVALESLNEKVVSELERQSAGNIILFKTHQPPTPLLQEMAAEGRLAAHANYRDPRDMALSLLDAGERSRRRGAGAFTRISNWSDALSTVESNAKHFRDWAKTPSTITTCYDEVAFRSASFLRRILAQLRVPEDQAPPLEPIIDQVKTECFTQLNHGVAKRHRDELSLNECLNLLLRFGHDMRRYMPEDLDAVDELLMTASQKVTTAVADQPRRRSGPCKRNRRKKRFKRIRRQQAAEAMPERARTFFLNNLLTHTHIEKSAGTSLLRTLEQALGDPNILDLRDRGQPGPKELSTDELNRITLLTGHFHFGAWDRFFGRHMLYIACIREPFERFRSYHAFVSDRPGHPAYPLIGNLELGAAVECAINARHGGANNYLARHLGGRRILPLFNRVRKVLDTRYVAVVPHDSVHRLTSLICEQLGLEAPENRSFNVQEYYRKDETGREMFKKHNALDYRVYEYVLENYEFWLSSFNDRWLRMMRS